jgi:hypothetical protein
MLTVGVASGMAVAMAHADSARAKPLAMYPTTLSVCSVFPAFSTLERHPLCCHLTVIAA